LKRSKKPKVEQQSVDQGAAGSAPLERSVSDMPERLDRYLLLETVLSLIVAVLAIKSVGTISVLRAGWLLTPLILVIAAYVPTKVGRRRFAKFGFTRRQIVASLAAVGRTCAALFPLVFAGLWVLKSCDVELPSPSVLPQEQGWIGWLFYQFMYVAMAEEVFFRGYVQSNILRLAGPLIGGRTRPAEWASIAISAVCFAVAHVIVQGQLVSVLTFLPGLVLGWLFIRTGSLLAPILFHGLANVCYVVMMSLFV
jgi:membrane protease YdiL (CAAX protease family)